VIARAIVIRILRLYKSFISPLLPSACRFYPSCSEYAMQAVEERGALRGSLLALWRLARCQPLTKGGYDPVPHEEQRIT
jgi:putative membrane protein insertion efficiency factor